MKFCSLLLLSTLCSSSSSSSSSSSKEADTRFILMPSAGHESQSIAVAIFLNGKEVKLRYSFDPGSDDDAYSTAKAFCTSHLIQDASCKDRVTLELIEEGAPLSALPFQGLKAIPAVTSLAKHLYSAARPKLAASLLESSLFSMNVLPIKGKTKEVALVQQQDFFQLLDLLAASYHSSDDTGGAEKIYTYLYNNGSKLLPGDNQRAALITNFAVNSFQHGDYAHARALFDEAEELLVSENSPNIRAMARIYSERAALEGEFPAGPAMLSALDYARRSVLLLKSLYEEIPDDEHQRDAFLEVENALATAYLTMGKLQLEQHKRLEAIDSLQRSVTISPDNVEAISTLNHAEDMPSYNNEVPSVDSASLDAISANLSYVQVEFVTFASDQTKCELQRLLKSAEHFSIDVTVLGSGILSSQWRNGMKLELLSEFVDSLADDAFVVVVDGYDVVISGCVEDFLNRYSKILALNTGEYDSNSGLRPVVFQADQTFYCPLVGQGISAEVARAYPKSPTKYRYLSSGGIAGEARSLSRLIRAVLSRYGGEQWEKKSDQSLFIRWACFLSFWEREGKQTKKYPDRFIIDLHRFFCIAFSPGTSPMAKAAMQIAMTGMTMMSKFLSTTIKSCSEGMGGTSERTLKSRHLSFTTTKPALIQFPCTRRVERRTSKNCTI